MLEREASLAPFGWRYEPDAAELSDPQTATTSPTSIALSKDLRKLGWKFVGPTTVFAFMQAMGLINDHTNYCAIRPPGRGGTPRLHTPRGWRSRSRRSPRAPCRRGAQPGGDDLVDLGGLALSDLGG